MKQIKFFLALFSAILLTACATTEKYEARLQTFVGKPESAVIEKLGAPSKIYDSGGNRYLTYSSSNYLLLDRDFGITMVCTTTFTVSNNIIQKYSFEGNGCKSK